VINFGGSRSHSSGGHVGFVENGCRVYILWRTFFYARSHDFKSLLLLLVLETEN
jgi:hypothetical protein